MSSAGSRGRAWSAADLIRHTCGLVGRGLDPEHPGRATGLAAALAADRAALRSADLVVVLRGGDAVAETIAEAFGLPVVSLIPGQRRAT